MKVQEKEFRKWLETNNASFKDAFTIMWWSMFNHKKADILMRCYLEGYNFIFAMKTARSGKFE